jgi:hypothetical protein
MALILRFAQQEMGKHSKIQIEQTAGTDSTLLESFLLVAFLLVFGLLHFQFLDWPILSGDDEAVHFKNQFWQFREFSSTPFISLIVLGSTSAAILFILTEFASPTRNLVNRLCPTNLSVAIKYIALGILLYIALYYNLKTASALTSGWGWENRWPPLGTILGVVSVLVFGENETAARLPSLLFYLGTGIFVYKIARQVLGWQGGVIAVAVLCSSPIFFQYGHLNFREAGGAFFITVAIYYLLSFHHTGSITYLCYSLFSLADGFLERRPVAGFLAVCLCYCNYKTIVAFKEERAILLKLFMQYSLLLSLHIVALALIFPWMQMSKGVREYHFNFANFLDWTLLTAYLKIFPEVIPWPIAIVMIVGIIVTIVKRFPAGVIALLTLLVFYALFTGDTPYWVPTDRFMVLFIPPIAILCAHTLMALHQHWMKFVLIGGILLSMTTSLIAWRIDKPRMALLAAKTKSLSSMPYYPFAELVDFLKKEDMDHGKILLPAHWQTPLEVYLSMRNIEDVSIVTPPWKKKVKRNATIAALSAECIRVGCDAILLRLVRDGNKTDISWLTDMPFSRLSEDRIDSFKVRKVLYFGNNGLALLVPRND